jgi:hypothetical protein
MQYKDGTYIAQVWGKSPAESLPKWLSSLNDRELKEWKLTREALTEAIDPDGFVALSGRTRVWCNTGLVKNALVLLNVVATDSTFISS